jgi:hypothetical protein
VQMNDGLDEVSTVLIPQMPYFQISIRSLVRRYWQSLLEFSTNYHRHFFNICSTIGKIGILQLILVFFDEYDPL